MTDHVERGLRWRMRWLVIACVLAAAGVGAAPPPGGEWRGESCHDDAGCRWDDPCKPTRCVGARAAAPAAACEKSLPPPGSCGCVEEMCTLRPERAAAAVSEGTCTKDDHCAVDVAGGTCHAGGETLIGPIHEQGPVCTCDPKGGHCTFEWAGPVTCKTWRDCSWVHKPRLRPVPSSKVKRPVRRPVRPCKDAEVDAICTPAGVCKIVGWSC